jgi:hypothetical protein
VARHASSALGKRRTSLVNKAEKLNLPRSLPLSFLWPFAAGSVWGVDPSRQMSQNAHTAWKSRWTFWLRIPLGLVLLVNGWLPLSAQTFYGSIVGRVSDKTGSFVKSASVIVTSLETSEKRAVTTDDSGDFRFVNLLPGLYRVEIESAGFKHFMQEPVEVRVDTIVFLDCSLALGDVRKTVHVQEQTPLPETSPGTRGFSMQVKRLRGLVRSPELSASIRFFARKHIFYSAA